MKVLVFLLVLANLLFYALSAGYFGAADNPDAGRVEQQVSPERLRIVSRGEAPAKVAEAPKPEVKSEDTVEAPLEAAPGKEASAKEAAKPAEAAPVCLAWEHLSLNDADRLGSVLADKFAAFKVSKKVSAGESTSWWVYIPPLANKAEMDKRAGELRQIEVTDFFPVQDGPNRYAISLGVFSSEKGGQERLAELKAKGIRGVKLAPRPGKDSTVRLQAVGPASGKEALMAAAGKALGKSSPLACSR